MGIAKEGGKSGKLKGGFLKSSRSGIKLGRTNHSARVHLVRTENLHRTGSMHKTRDKTCQNQFPITERKLPNLKGILHKPQIPLLSTAALLQCRKNRKSLSPSCCHDWQGKGSLARAANCAVSSPHLLRPPGCTPRRNAPQADSPHRPSDVLCDKEPQVCLCPVPLLTLWAPPQSHQELSEKAPQPF